MGGVRRWQAAGLAAVSALALLGLATLPVPRAPRAPRPRPAPLAAPAPAPASPPTPPAPSSPPSNTTAQAVRREPGVLYVRDMYVPGHERAHPELCPERGAHLRLLILVTSAPSHAQARDAVRLTWGHYSTRSDVAIAFVLGQPPAALQPALAAEDAIYGDLIVGNSLDSYSNLTLKTISMLEWTSKYCSEVRHVLKTDDDMFLNVPRLLSFVASKKVANASRTVWGRLIHKSFPKRTLRCKYYVSVSEYPGRGPFPNFTTGPAYLMSGDCVRPLLDAATDPLRRYLRLEDVFVTGVLATELGVRRVHAPSFYNRKVSPHPCAIQRAATIHMVRYHEQFDFWRKLLDGKVKCSS